MYARYSFCEYAKSNVFLSAGDPGCYPGSEFFPLGSRIPGKNLSISNPLFLSSRKTDLGCSSLDSDFFPSRIPGGQKAPGIRNTGFSYVPATDRPRRTCPASENSASAQSRRCCHSCCRPPPRAPAQCPAPCRRVADPH